MPWKAEKAESSGEINLLEQSDYSRGPALRSENMTQHPKWFDPTPQLKKYKAKTVQRYGQAYFGGGKAT